MINLNRVALLLLGAGNVVRKKKVLVIYCAVVLFFGVNDRNILGPMKMKKMFKKMPLEKLLKWRRLTRQKWEWEISTSST